MGEKEKRMANHDYVFRYIEPFKDDMEGMELGSVGKPVAGVARLRDAA